MNDLLFGVLRLAIHISAALVLLWPFVGMVVDRIAQHRMNIELAKIQKMAKLVDAFLTDYGRLVKEQQEAIKLSHFGL